jgi:hypothetical protein
MFAVLFVERRNAKVIANAVVIAMFSKSRQCHGLLRPSVHASNTHVKKKLELVLGAKDLSIRIGIHSGPVTAELLRSWESRLLLILFYLFRPSGSRIVFWMGDWFPFSLSVVSSSAT